MDLAAVVAWYEPVRAQIVESGLANEMGVYERLLDFLAGDPRFEPCPLAELLAPLEDGRVRICLRHDVDSLLPPTLSAAQALSCRGLRGSFYFLHTAIYYGQFVENTFLRNPAIGDFIDTFGHCGQEIGLHIDPLTVYFTFGVDGAQSVLTELSWLRGQGIDVKGALAHNSAPVFGAENFEIFSGLALDDRRHVTHEGVTVPLQSVGMDEAGLAYEGNFPLPPDENDRVLLGNYLGCIPQDALRRADWLSVYLQHNPVFSRPNDVSIWLLGADMWAIAESRPRKRFLFNVGHVELIEYLKRYAAPGRIVIVIHPEYLCR